MAMALRYVDSVVHVPLEKQVHVPVVETVEKTVEVPQIEYVAPGRAKKSMGKASKA